MCLVLFISNAKAQVVNWVDNDYNADIKVYLTDYRYEADVVVFKTNYKYDAKVKPGQWWWEENPDGRYEYNKINVREVKYKYQADFIVYFTNYKSEIKLSQEYLNVIEEWER